jgi:hypothetical protein
MEVLISIIIVFYLILQITDTILVLVMCDMDTRRSMIKANGELFFAVGFPFALYVARNRFGDRR